MSHTLGMKYQGLKIIIIIIIIQHLYSTMTSLEDTEALVVPARSVGTGGF